MTNQPAPTRLKSTGARGRRPKGELVALGAIAECAAALRHPELMRPAYERRDLTDELRHQCADLADQIPADVDGPTVYLTAAAARRLYDRGRILLLRP